MSSLEDEMKLAVATASMSDSRRARKVMLIESGLPSLIPSGSLLSVRSIKFTELKMGDVICIRGKKDVEVRRFVKSRVEKADNVLLVAQEGVKTKQTLTRDAYLGKVEKVEFGGKVFDPNKASNPIRNFWDKLTEYGTHKPFGLFG